MSLAALCDELTTLAGNLVPMEEMERARVELAGGLLIGGQSNASRVTRAQRDVMYGRPADDLAHLIDQVNACTRQEVRAAAARYLHTDRHAEVTLGPA